MTFVLPPNPNRRLPFYSLPGYESFLVDIVSFLKTRYEVRTCYTEDEQEVDSTVEWADIVWLEWANSIAAHVTHNIPSISQKKIVCRIHRYEVLNGYLAQIDWTKIDKTIFVADHIRDIAYETYPSIANETECLIINNGVDLQKFSFRKREHGYNLAIVGNVNNRKNPAVWAEIMDTLINLNPQYKLKVAGEIQELEYKYYFENIISKLGLAKNIEFIGKIENIPGWFENENINYLLTTSICESFGYGIAEAMAMGYKPLIHNFPNAEDIWPQNCIFSTTNELITILKDIESYNSQKYHKFVRDRYSLNSQLETIDTMLIDLINDNPTQATTVSTEKQENHIKVRTHSPRTTIDISNLNKPHKNLIVTGIPRSGSSLFSVLINSIENAVCLNEIVYDVLKLPSAFEEIRKRLVLKTPIPNKYDSSGVLTSNTQDGTVNIEEKVVEIVDDNVVVAEHIRDIKVLLTPEIKNATMSIIPNGISLDKWKFRTREKGFDIAYVGSIWLPHLLNAVHNIDLHIAGIIQDPRYSLYFNQMVQDMGLSNNFIMYGNIDDIDTWLEDKDYIISASLLESQQLGICEAMAKGIKPIIHNFVGARSLYPEKYIWNSIQDFAKKRYSSNEQHETINPALDDLSIN